MTMANSLFNPKGPILIFGDLILDEWLYGTATRLSPEAPVPVVAAGYYVNTLGGAGNVAANVAALGGTPFLVTLKSNALAMDRCLIEGGVDDKYCITGHMHQVPHKVRVIANGHQICRIDREDTNPISAEAQEHLHGKILDCIAKEEPAVIIVSDYNKGIVTQNLMLAIIEASRGGRDIPVLLDPKPLNMKSYPSSISVMTPNVHEAEAMTGIHITDSVSLEDAGRTLLFRYGCKHVIITRGEDGMVVFSNMTPLGAKSADVDVEYIPSEAQQVFDVAGAGDTVIATLAVALASGCDFSVAAAWANRAAGIAVSKAGTAIVTLDELEG